MLAAVLCLLLTRPAPQPAPAIPEPPAKEAPAEDGPGAQFRLDADSVVILDGKPAAFADVPTTATVVRLDLKADGKTIIRIDFKSKP